ncbi:HEAT repeat domain-containing protein [Acidobacteriota bacterium]
MFLNNFLEGDVRFAEGATIRYRLKNTAKIHRDIIKKVLRLVELAKRLRISNEIIPRRLARNADRQDELMAVRIRNLTLLQKNYSKSPVAFEASRKAMHESQDNHLRLLGAMFLGEEGFEVVRDLVLSEKVKATLRIAGMKHLAKPSTGREIIPLLQNLLRSYSPRVAKAATNEILLLIRNVPIAMLSQLLIALADKADEQAARVLTEILIKTGDPAAEPCLLWLLGRNELPIKRLSVRALNAIGTIRAVEPLLELTKGITRSSDLKREANQAIKQIQGRLGDAGAGRLSLATPAELDGGLSIAALADKEGGLSLDSEMSDQATSDAEGKADSKAEDGASRHRSMSKERTKAEE